jgi:hypothetical protein
MMIDGSTSSFGSIESMKGCDDLFGCDGLRRSAKHPKDMKIHDGDLWIPYKRTRAHNQGRRLAQQGGKDQLYDYEVDFYL